ncbi:MAG: hypothetical protein KIT20_04410 [Alphaproteobacteria bacterium]|nr:hypothetical protein [Alphaproteobacteria bacterium]
MRSWQSEPSLREMLDDPIVRLVMRRDGVDREQIRELLEPLRNAETADGKLSLARADKAS